MSKASHNKPFLIKAEDGTVVLRAESTYYKTAQEFLGKSGSHISKIYHLEHENQTLEERAKLLGRNIAKDLASDLNSILRFVILRVLLYLLLRYDPSSFTPFFQISSLIR